MPTTFRLEAGETRRAEPLIGSIITSRNGQLLCTSTTSEPSNFFCRISRQITLLDIPIILECQLVLQLGFTWNTGFSRVINVALFVGVLEIKEKRQVGLKIGGQSSGTEELGLEHPERSRRKLRVSKIPPQRGRPIPLDFAIRRTCSFSINIAFSTVYLIKGSGRGVSTQRRAGALLCRYTKRQHYHFPSVYFF